MKTTIKILALATAGLLAIKAIAQNHHKHRFAHLQPEELLEKLDAKLHLNKTQEKRVLTLLENRMAEHKTLREKRKAIHHKEREVIKQKMKTVLTAEQFEKLQELKKEHRKERMHADHKNGHHKRMHPKERLEKLTQELDLNQKQQDEIKTIFRAHRAEIKKNHPEFKQERKRFKAKFERDMKTILTPEQFKTFKILKEERRMNKKQRIDR